MKTPYEGLLADSAFWTPRKAGLGSNPSSRLSFLVGGWGGGEQARENVQVCKLQEVAEQGMKRQAHPLLLPRFPWAWAPDREAEGTTSPYLDKYPANM